MLLPVLTLLPLERGLTLSQLGQAAAVQGLVVFLIELPTGGLSDSLGRKPVLVASGIVSLGGFALIYTADSFLLFAVAFAVQGIYRALDSGPLEAWYVDTVLAHDPDADISGGLSGGGVVASIAIGGGALLAGGLVALDPWSSVEALAVPVIVAAVFRAVSVVATIALLHEAKPRTGWAATSAAVRDVPRVIVGGLRLLRRSKVLQVLIWVEVVWGFGMVAMESLTPIHLADIVSNADDAAAIMGPVNSAAWVASAVGAWLAAVAARRVGAARAAMALHVLLGAAVVGIALSAGAVGLIIAFLVGYIANGAVTPLHMTMLHERATSENRVTIVSVGSMAGQAAGSLGLIALTAVADGASVAAAMGLGGLALALCALLYLPVRRDDRRAGRSDRRDLKASS